MGSPRDYTNPHDVTSWCVRKWEEAGAVIVGKLNMHELGLGKSTIHQQSFTSAKDHHLTIQIPRTTTPRKGLLSTHITLTTTPAVPPAAPPTPQPQVYSPSHSVQTGEARSASQPPTVDSTVLNQATLASPAHPPSGSPSPPGSPAP